MHFAPGTASRSAANERLVDSSSSPTCFPYSSMMDANLLDKGRDFDALAETYVIFITEHDVLGMGKPLYHIERYILETGERFEDGSHILYVNGEYRDDSPIGRLMHDFSCTDPSEMYFNVLADRVRFIKESKEGVAIMCKAMEDMRNEALEIGRVRGLEEGRTEGHLNTLIDSVRSLKAKLGLTDQQVRDALNITNEDWEQIALRV